MDHARPLRFYLAVLAIAVFAACSGGGGSSIPSAGGSGASGGSGGSAASTAERAQTDANSALSIAGNSLDADQFGSSGGAINLAVQRAIASRNSRLHAMASSTPTPSPTTACQNGVEFSQSSTGSGQYTETIEFFYDSQCTQPRKLVTLNITFASGSGTATGTEELWDSSGNVVDYKTDNATFTFQSGSGQLAQISVERSVAAAPSATPFAEDGFTCVFSSANPIDCGDGIVATIDDQRLDPHVYATVTPAPTASPSSSPSASPAASPTPYEIGFTGTIVGTQASPSASPSSGPNFGWNPRSVALQLTVAGAGYTGATQSMTIASAAAPAWSITGGQQVTTLSGTANLGFGPSGMFSNASITLDDTADGLTIALTSSGQHGGLSGTVTNSSGQTVASVIVDGNGDGVIDYTTGGTAQIRDWVILGSLGS